MLKRCLRPVLRVAFSVIFCLVGLPLLYAIEPVVRVRIGLIPYFHIGNIAHHTDLFLRRLALEGRPPRTLYLLFSGPPANRTLLKLFARRLNIVQNEWISRAYLLIEPILRRTRFHEPLLRDSRYYPWPIDVDMFHVYAHTRSQLAFTAAEEARGREGLAQMGIEPTDWFVCFHARDSTHYAERGHSNTVNRDKAIRDASIQNFLKGAQIIVDLGGYAIRMGAAVAEPLPASLDARIIDYATHHRSDFMDVYLSARCRFFIGTTAGLVCVPYVFDVPVGMSNAIPLEMVAWRRSDLFIPKLLRDQSTGRFLTFEECAHLGLFDFRGGKPHGNASDYVRLGIDVVENDADDVGGLVRDMYLQDIGQVPDTEALRLQESYRARYFSGFPYIDLAGKLAPSFALRHRELIDPEGSA